MTKNPIVNSVSALVYISLIASLFFYGSKIMGSKEDTILAPIAMLSLLVLSVAVMGYIFFFQPLQLYLDDDKKSAINLFLKTLASFAVIVAIVFATILVGAR